MDRILEVFRQYKIPLILGGLSVFTITISIILLVKSVATTTPIEFSSDQVATGSSVIKIDVEGAVVSPGLYSLPEGSRVEDAITAAGGLSKDVDGETLAKSINRAMKLVDGGKIFIPSVHSSPISPQSPLSPLISVNSGSQSELESLPGIGPVTAKKIIDNRPYQTPEELVSKKAVGQSVFEKIKNQISL